MRIYVNFEYFWFVTAMSTVPTNAEKIRQLPWSIAHNAANTVFCQFTVFGSVFILFLNELGMPKTQIGFILSLFPFCGLLALFIAPAVARAGFKRIYIIFWGVRKFVVSFLLLTLWVLTQFGLQATFIYVVAILLVFAICRAIAETAFYPWYQEIIPDSIRGKYSAINNIIVALISALAVAVASYVVGHFAGLSRFMGLMAAGVIFGFISVWCMFFVPGGAPIRGKGAERAHFKRMMNALQDRNFITYLGGLGAITLVSVSFFSFIPLFMKEEVGLNSGNIVLLQMGTLFGGLVSGYLWGWAADRYGSKPVLLSGLHMMILLPVCWLLMPRHSVSSSWIAMSIAFLFGLVAAGQGLGVNRLLYVSVVPPERKTEYMAIYYAWIGLTGGCGRLIAGRTLDYCQGIKGKFFIVPLDPYTPLLVVSMMLLVVGVLLFRHVRADGGMPAGKFAGMFLRGNPFMAFESMFRYGLAKEESDRVSMTERLGEAKSPLNVDELLEALSDPSFNVRYEAIISITRTRSDDKLVTALIHVLDGSNPDLSTAAAWALGRIGDKRAIEPLRKALASGYPLLQARSARALAILGDLHAAPILLRRFREERDDGLRMAYASALGSLRETDATSDLLHFLRAVQDKDAQVELALALARITGDEHYFIRLWRQIRLEIGTVASQAVLALKRKLKKLRMDSDNLMILVVVDECAEAFAKNDVISGAALLSDIIDNLPMEKFRENAALILNDCAARLDEFGASRAEYIILSLHTINASLNALQQRSG